MKRARKTILITFIIMVALTAGLIFLMTRAKPVSDDLAEQIAQDQSGQTEKRAYLTEMEQNAKQLQMSGDNKNVLNFDSKNAYNTAESKAARERLDRVIKRITPTFEEPVIAANPFGTNLNSFYFYFTTDSSYMTRYTITVADRSIQDHIRYVNNGQENNLSKIHEFTVSGLVPGMTNFIIIDILDQGGNVRKSQVYRYDAQSVPVNTRLSVQKGNSKDSVRNGLYFVLPAGDKGIYAYDNSGVLRNATLTETGHGSRIYQSGECILYQVSDTKAVKVSATGQVLGTAEISGYGRMRDFAYDGYDNIYSLVRKNKRDYLLATSFQTGKTRVAYTFPKNVQTVSIAMQGGGTAYIICEKPNAVMKLEALTSKAPRLALILGRKDDWKKIPSKKNSWKKRVTEDKDPANWNMKNAVLNLVQDRSNGTVDMMTVYLSNRGKGTGIIFTVDGKSKNTVVNHSFPTGQSGRCGCEVYEDHFLISNFDRGVFAEYDDRGKVTKEFNAGTAVTAVTKLSLNGMCFYNG